MTCSVRSIITDPDRGRGIAGTGHTSHSPGKRAQSRHHKILNQELPQSLFMAEDTLIYADSAACDKFAHPPIPNVYNSTSLQAKSAPRRQLPKTQKIALSSTKRLLL